MLLVLASCSARAREPAPIEPPPDTGAIAIDMEGLWAVASIARLDGNEPLPFVDPTATPFLSVQPGQMICFRGGIAYDLHDEPLYALFDPTRPNRRYTNSADGRFWSFEVEYFRGGECTLELTIRAAFGSFDADTMDGVVQVHYATDCPSPSNVRPDPNGLFLVRMARVASPTAGR